MWSEVQGFYFFLTFSHLSTCCRAQGARKGNRTVYLSVMIRAKHGGTALQGNMRIWTNVHVLLNLIYSFFINCIFYMYLPFS